MLKHYYYHPTDYIQYDHLKTFGPMSFGNHEHIGKYEIYFFVSGNAEFITHGNKHKLKFGDIFLVKDTDFHGVYVTPGEPYERILIHFRPEPFRLLSSPKLDLLEPFALENPEPVMLVPSDDVLKKIIKIFNDIEELEKNLTESFAVLYLLRFIELLVLLHKIYSDSVESGGNGKLTPRLIEIIDFIENNLENKITLDILEKRFYINGSYLSRMFKKSIGINLSNYIIHKRISRAQELLLVGMNVYEACYLSGFNNYNHFIKVFKKHTGISPLQFKKKQLSG